MYRRGALCSRNPAPPISITTISNVLTSRVSVALSYLSAIWPDVAENSTKGMMKMAEIRNAAVLGSTPEKRAAWNVTSDVKPTLKTLSLSAPRNWVQKNGAKRRSRSRSNWLSSRPSLRRAATCLLESVGWLMVHWSGKVGDYRGLLKTAWSPGTKKKRAVG